jgi:feruloyl esterase
VAFYETLSPGLTAKQKQAQLRLFMVPGMNHCSGGEGPSAIDTLGTIDQWASSGSAPDRLIASRAATPAGAPGPQQPAMTRPLCPYPQVARYKGQGPTDQAESFACAAPPAAKG